MKQRLLIIKKGAAGDVVRTTPILHMFKDWEVDWLVDKINSELLDFGMINNVLVSFEQLDRTKEYDLVISLEDEYNYLLEVYKRIKYKRIFGSFIEGDRICYTDSSQEWFDMSLISRLGLGRANLLKLSNRRSYQEIIFSGLGFEFKDHSYIIPTHNIPKSKLTGDIAIARFAGKRWPMKEWGFFDDLFDLLKKEYEVNVLPVRSKIKEHLADIANHRIVVSNDSLPMHLSLGLGIPCVAIFICTSPWEIYDYGILRKVVSPKLEQYFYRKDWIEDAVKSIPLEMVYDILKQHFIKNENNSI